MWTLPTDLRKFWRGGYSLAISFWLFGLVGWWLVGLLLGMVVVAPFAFIGAHDLGFGLALILWASYTAFAMVAIWRSASARSLAEEGSLWPIAAKIVICAVAIWWLAVLFYKSGFASLVVQL